MRKEVKKGKEREISSCLISVNSSTRQQIKINKEAEEGEEEDEDKKR